MLYFSKLYILIVFAEICFYIPLALTLNAWEDGDTFEGDMLLTEEQNKMVDAAQEDASRDVHSATRLWPGNTVVYSINTEHFNSEVIDLIWDAMHDIETHTCVSFRPQQNDEHAVMIEGHVPFCFSNVGYNDDPAQQRLNLGAACLTRGNIQHQLLHTLGMFHTQSARDRDEYVKINFDNVKKGQESNFKKYTDHERLGVPYDLDSLMHYSDTAFSKNGEKTIEPLEPDTIGQNEGASKVDLLTINKMYGCDHSIGI